MRLTFLYVVGGVGGVVKARSVRQAIIRAKTLYLVTAGLAPWSTELQAARSALAHAVVLELAPIHIARLRHLRQSPVRTTELTSLEKIINSMKVTE